MLTHIGEQSKHIGEQDKRTNSQAQAIKWCDAKIEGITFQLARFKAWKFGVRTEAMNAEQRALFNETCAADQADLEAQLAARGPAHRARKHPLPNARMRPAYGACGQRHQRAAGHRARAVLRAASDSRQVGLPVLSAKLNGHEPWAYLKDVLTRLPMQLNSRIEELLPHKSQPVG